MRTQIAVVLLAVHFGSASAETSEPLAEFDAFVAKGVAGEVETLEIDGLEFRHQSEAR